MKKQILIIGLIIYALSSFANANLNHNSYNRKKTSLNGIWRVIVDPYENGSYNYRLDRFDQMSKSPRSAYYMDAQVKDKTDRLEYNFNTAETMVVPGSWNMQNDKYYWYEGSMWYRKKFDYSKSDNAKQFIRFEGVNYKSDVYLNGKKLGTHVGGFTPFEFEASKELKNGENSLVVLVNNNRHRNAVPTVNTDWFNYGGITRDVYIYETPNTYIKDYTLQLRKGSTFDVKFQLKFEGEKLKSGVTLEIPELGVKEKFKAREVFSESLKLIDLELWSPKNPKLYDVIISYGEDIIHDKIGFRTISTKGHDILLNGEKLFLKGISVHEENPIRSDRAYSMDDARTMLQWVKELGCNFVRLAHYPHNENMARLADEMGIMLWEEIPVYWTIAWENKETYANAENQLSELLTRDKNRASVIVWSMSNETPPGEARTKFLRKLLNYTRNYDNTRLVSAALEKRKDKSNKNIMIVDDEFAEYVDILSFNEYIGWYTGKPTKCEKIEWKIKVDKPVVISEFGGGALAGFHGDETTQWTEEYQAAIYREQLKMLSKIPQWAGCTPWILSDFRSPRRPLANIQDGYNRKGLISEKGERKKAFYVLQEFYLKK
jgi:beta-glucuronidase